MYEVLYFEKNILKIVKLKELLIKSWSLTENSLYYKYQIQKEKRVTYNMAVYVVGDFLRETRLRKGYTQPANKKSRLK